MKVAIWVALVVALLTAILLAGCSPAKPEPAAPSTVPRLILPDGKVYTGFAYGYEPQGDQCFLVRWIESNGQIVSTVPCTEKVLRLAGQPPRDPRQAALAKLNDRERAALGIVP